MHYLEIDKRVDKWPMAVSDGLSVPCSDCETIPVIDYIVDDYTWNDLVKPPERHGVICLPCLIKRGGPSVLLAVKEIQYTIPGVTLILSPSLFVNYGGLII
jgi:hypothetical protein